MGLMELDGMDKEPNKGGRPPKKDEEERREASGDPYTEEDGEGYWSVTWNKFYDESKEIHEVVAEVAGYAHCLPRAVVQKVDEHDIHDMEQYTDEWEKWSKWLSDDVDLTSSGTSPGWMSEVDGLSGASSTSSEDDSEEASDRLQRMFGN